MIRRSLAALALALCLAAFGPVGGTIKINGGDVVYVEGDHATPLTHDHMALEAALSPDGKSVAWIRKEPAPSGDEGGPGATSLNLVDRTSGRSRLLLASTPADGMTETLQAFHHPTFSLDGGFVYVMASAWVTSDAVHQINIRTGAHRFVIDATSMAVIRNGPYRGMLLVSRHLYHPAPEYGAYEPTFVVRPDAHVVLKVPGSDDDDAAVDRWLKTNGWEAW